MTFNHTAGLKLIKPMCLGRQLCTSFSYDVEPMCLLENYLVGLEYNSRIYIIIYV